MRNIKYWYLGSDLHGDWRPVRNWVVNDLSTPKEESALILLGDVGANYFLNKRDREFKEQLNKLDIEIYCLRGNHEMRISDAKNYGNYRQYYNINVKGDIWIEEGYPNIYYFKDEGGIYKIQGKSILTIPGAYSVDKYYRLRMGWSWFPNEQLSIEEWHTLEHLIKDKQFDYIFAHSCPHSWEPYIDDLFLNSINQNEVNKDTEDFIDDILHDYLYYQYDHFYFGHFHDDRDIPEVKATMLYKKIIPLGEYIKES